MSSTGMKMVGTEKVVQALEKALGKGWTDQDVRKIVRKGANVIVREAQLRAPVSKAQHYYISPSGARVTFMPGNLKNSIKVLPKFRKDPRGVYVGPKVVRRNVSGSYGAGSRVNAYYAHFVEYGTRSHSVGFKGKHVTGKGATVRGITARPYMRPAYDNKAQEAIDVIMRETWRFIEKRVPTTAI